MFELILYAIGFFLITLLFQYLLHRFRKNGNRGKGAIWVGKSAAIVICVMGIVSKNINYLGAVLGFLMAAEIGKRWDGRKYSCDYYSRIRGITHGC